MFGARREREELRARLTALEGEVAALRSDDDTARRLLDDAQLLQRLADEASRTSHAAEATLAALREASAEAGLHGKRFEPEFNRVYLAERAGYVATWFASGLTDKVEVLVGSEDPPTMLVSRANSRNDINGYASTVVRPGEHWMIRSKVGGSSGFKAMFTPLV